MKFESDFIKNCYVHLVEFKFLPRTQTYAKEKTAMLRNGLQDCSVYFSSLYCYIAREL